MLGLDLPVVLVNLVGKYIQKGFGEEAPGLQQKLEKFFNEYGRVNAVRMRRIDDTKLFKVRKTFFSLFLSETLHLRSSFLPEICVLLEFSFCGVLGYVECQAFP